MDCVVGFFMLQNISSDGKIGRLHKSGTCHKVKRRPSNGEEVPNPCRRGCGSIGTCLTGVPQSTDVAWKVEVFRILIDIETQTT